ncbi:hypothetical protein SAMN06265365_102155 [Tistlia consotensis]|uniref:Uncharacterized protein n=1 Tax=Tistlia consotensis USBA 355 TaxID=560819 RepID=A0A1Y6BGK9_9PROT|nr:hypothetical protein [Tistlia consotensis]SMF08770.1 hypothetical protein SAMN05428998_104161 [Tistlia consotensis USBA 355]SNR35180.1 hypothetical protein SAMN06265365_102155 [Tistlia consotensis]
MRALERLTALAAALVMLAALALPAAAALSEQDQAAIRNYTLTTRYLSQVQALTRDAEAKGVKASLDADDFKKAKDLDALAAQLDAKPGVHALMAAHGLTAREYLVGALALYGAGMVVKYGDDPQQGKYIDKSKANPKNVEFYKQHQKEIEAMMAAEQK